MKFDIPIFPTIKFAHSFSADSYHGELCKCENRLEITVITDGELKFDRCGERIVAKKGDVIFSDYLTDVLAFADKRHSHQTVCFALDARVLPFKIPFLTKVDQEPSVCRFLIDKIIRTYLCDPKNDLKLTGLFMQLLGELEAMHRQTEKNGSPGEFHYVERAKNYIHEHICEPIAQKDIAAHLEVTPQYLCAVFKKIEGCSVMRFINELKLSHVKTMMTEKRVTLAQASGQLGYTDPNYVSKLYRKYYQENITTAAKTLKYHRKL